MYGAGNDHKAMVSKLLHTLIRPVMQLNHLLWRATAVDHAINAGCMQRGDALTY